VFVCVCVCACVRVRVRVSVRPNKVNAASLTLSLQSNPKASSVVVCITLDTGISERLTGTELVLS